MAPSPHRISFSGSLTAKNLEQALRDFYSSGGKRSPAQVVFGLDQLTWCDPYALSLLILWARVLKIRGVEVSVLLPIPDEINAEDSTPSGSQYESTLARRRLFSFLVQSRFLDILDEYGITHPTVDISLSERQPKSTHSWLSPFLPFRKWGDLKSFLSALRSVEQMRLFFKEAYQYRVVKSGKIRDVILRELGDNIFDHADGDSGHLVMNKTSTRGYGAPSWEESFFRTLRGGEYLEIVISDKGPGIFKTLLQAYRDDPALRNKAAKPTNADLLEYAFLQYSTKKTLEERLKKFVDVLKSTKQMDVIPATGLYWVKETCREFGALLCVRSRTSILAYDFLTRPDQKKPRRVESFSLGRRAHKLHDLPGVQIKMCFPLSHAEEERPRILPRYPVIPSKTQSYRLITLATFLGGSDPDNLNSQAKPILDVINEIQTIKLEDDDPKVIILDLEDSPLSNKALFILGVELMRMQDAEHLIVTINADSLNSPKTRPSPDHQCVFAFGEDD